MKVLERPWGPRFLWFAVRVAIKRKVSSNGHLLKPTGIVGTFYGVTVVRAYAKVPYGHSTWQGKKLYRTHRVQHLYVCWYDGKVIGHAVQWLCGPYTPHFALTSEIEKNPCKACETRRKS